MKQIKTAAQAVEAVKDGSSIMIGGFMVCGHPFTLVDEVLKKGLKDLTLITNDAGFPEKGIGKLIVSGQTKCLIVSHIGLNPVAGQKMHSGEMEVQLVPQGTLAERIRAKGAGLGGILTPTGAGTEVEKGKQKFNLNGKDYILENPIGADFAFIKATIADKNGNCFVAKSAKNFNLVMAMAADCVIAEAEKIVEPGELDPELVTVPGVFVNALVSAQINDRSF
ncbi:MAG: branched-chain amino acid dehydrogenase [Elusimicrobia bacterium CG08_land_8_20_14_0_20_51_18]|nr:MAG: branched-chain amino acid dehydrogenase [Elusimicrobia bacterium CG08_land_8_20_14_0_20_51_18]